MPLSDNAKSHLTATLALTNLFTDKIGEYLSLPLQIKAMQQSLNLIQQYLNDPYHTPERPPY